MRAVLSLVLLVGACGGAGAGAREASVKLLTQGPLLREAPSHKVGLYPGESMTFEITMGGVLAGEAALAVGQPGVVDGHRAIKVSSRIGSAGVFRMVKVIEDDLTSTIDLDTGLTFQIVADVQYGPAIYHADGQFNHAKVDLAWTRGDNHVNYTHMDFGKLDATDAHSAMALMRTWEGKPGETRQLYVVGGRKIWRTEATWVGRETIGTRLGNQHVVRLDGTSQQVNGDLSPQTDKKPRTFSVWMTDDADRVPVKVVAHTELGDVVIDLTGYERS